MKKRAFIYIILAGVLWGSSGLFVNFLAPFGLTSLQIASVRGIGAAISMIIYALISQRECFKISAKEILMFFFSGMAMFSTAVSYFSSMQASSVPTAVVLMYTAPVMVMIYSVVFMGEKFTKPKLLSLVFMIVGCGLVSGIIGGLKFSPLGVAMGLMAGLSYSTYNILTKIQMKRSCNPLSASMYCFIFMAGVSLFVSEPTEIVSVAVRNPMTVFLMLGCGICTCALPYLFYTLALKSLPVGTAASLSVVEPLSATVFSVMFLNVDADIYLAIGMVLIISAIFILSKASE